MKNRNILLPIKLIILFIITNLYAEKVTLNEISNASNNFIKKKEIQWQYNSMEFAQNNYQVQEIDSLLDPNTDEVLSYIAKLIPKGYIAFSARTEIQPIIAYSFLSNYIDHDKRNNILHDMIILDMQYRQKFLDNGLMDKSDIDRSESKWVNLIENNPLEKFGVTDIIAWPSENRGWINTTWGQGDTEYIDKIYNDLCPDDPKTEPGDNTFDGRCITGCVATGMGQIINYWGSNTGKPASVTFSSSDDYVSNCDPNDGNGLRTIPINAASANINSISYPCTDQEIAALLYACGVSVKMDYSDKASGAYTEAVDDALKSIFNFEEAEVSAPTTNSSFYEELSNNMKYGYPALLEIKNIGDPSKDILHEIVCDGFKIENSTNYYHLNFGWEGISDGYYELPEGMPAGYSVVNYGVINIRNNNGISAITCTELFINQSGTISVNIKAPSNGNYYAKVFNENLLPPLDWNWASSSTDLVSLSEGEDWQFNFEVEPNSSQESFLFFLYKQSWIPGVFYIIDTEQQTFTVNSPDLTPPIIHITSPIAGSTVSGMVTVNVDATDDESGIDKVALYADGIYVGEDDSVPYSIDWNSDLYNDGTHSLLAEAIDIAGNSNQDELSVVVQNATNAPEFYNGSVSPISGLNTDSYTFSVTYRDLNNDPPEPNSTFVYVDGQAHAMSALSDNWSAGVEFTFEIAGFDIGAHSYYFTSTSREENLRFPENGALSFNVIQDAAGWDIRVTDLTSSPTYLGAGESFTATARVHNDSNAPDKIYYNVPYSFKLFDPSGNLVNEQNGNISQLAQTSSIEISRTFNIPSGGDGNYRLTFTLQPDLDDNSANNTLSRLIIVGEEGPSNQWYISNSNLWAELNSSESYSFAGNSYTLTYVSGSYIQIRQDSGTPRNISVGDFRVYNSGQVILICEAINNIGALSAFISFGSQNTDYVRFDETNISCLPGATVEFAGNCQYETFANSDPDIYTNSTVEDWYSRLSFESGSHRALFRFRIPNSATPGEYSFFIGAEMSEGKFVRELKITVLNSPPVISQLNPTTFSADDEIAVTGDNFGSSGTVKFDNLDAMNIISWTNTSISCEVPEGAQSGNLCVINGNGMSNVIPYQIISSTGDPEIISPIPDQTITAGESKTIADLNRVFSDPNGDKLTFSVEINSPEVSYNGDSLNIGILSVTANNNVNTSTLIKINALDSDDAIQTDEFTLTIRDVNDPPQISVIPDTLFGEDNTLIIPLAYYQKFASDPDDDLNDLSYEIVNYSPLTVEMENNEFVFSAPQDWSGSIRPSLKITDKAVSIARSFNVKVLEVNDAPVINNLPEMVEFCGDSTAVINIWDYVEDVEQPASTLTYDFSTTNDSLVAKFESTAGKLTLSASNYFSGEAELFVHVTDDSGAVADGDIQVTVTPPLGIMEQFSGKVPTDYELMQNFPNPFNPTTRIMFGLPKAGKVILDVYNILGQRVDVIYNGYKNAGYHVIEFDATHLGSGVYIYRLRAGNFQQIKKLLLMK